MKIDGRTFLVSGGASGMGKASVLELVDNGANVAVLDVTEAGQALASEHASSIKFFHCDVTDTSSIARALQRTVQWTRETKRPLSGVLSAAGIFDTTWILGNDGSSLDLETVDKLLSVNVRGTIDLVRQAAGQIAKCEAGSDGERGVIVMITSAAAFDGPAGAAVYSASKAAIRGLTLPLARELAPYGIRCVAIAPGIFETPMFHAASGAVVETCIAGVTFPRRPGRPQEFAQLFRQCVENSMLNGTVLRLDGAMRTVKG